MLRKICSLNKYKKNVKFNFIIFLFTMFLVVFVIFFSFIVLLNLNKNICVTASSSYIPTPPIGNTTGDINVEYEYIFYTSSIGSNWRFDWGDGSYSDWTEVEESDSYISQNHSWKSYGEYNVRIKNKNIYNQESQWSLPLIVNITSPSDLDKDGWNNKIEESYKKDPKNPNDYPLDTDSDGIPDDNSDDGKYTGDLDDDNDGLSDLIEKLLGSNPKDNNDVLNIIILGKNYYLIDTNNDGDSNIFYNSQTNIQTKTSIKDGRIYLDINNDKSWDYIYFKGIISKYEGEFPWIYLIILFIIVPIAIVIILFKKGILFLYEEEYIKEK